MEDTQVRGGGVGEREAAHGYNIARGRQMVANRPRPLSFDPQRQRQNAYGALSYIRHWYIETILSFFLTRLNAFVY